jgi:hypothetical protein
MKSGLTVILAGLVIAGMFLAVQPVIAHHSGAEFGDKQVEIEGTVKAFQFTNPHSWIQVDVTGANGKKEEWSLEWGSPNQLVRDGYRVSTFPAGAKVTMRMRPARNGQPLGIFVAAKFADGKTIGTWR